MKRFHIPDGIPAHNLVPLIAHDLRTPITAIKGYGQLVLRQAAVSAKVATYLASVVDEANLVATLIDDLVYVTQMERGEARIAPIQLDLALLLQQVADEYLPSGHETRLSFGKATEPIPAYCDPEATRRAVVSFLQFAVKFCRTDQSCHVSAFRDAVRQVAFVAAQAGATSDAAVIGEPVVSEISTPDNALGRRDLRLYLCTKLAELQNGYILGDTDSSDRFQLYLVLPSGAGPAAGASGG